MMNMDMNMMMNSDDDDVVVIIRIKCEEIYHSIIAWYILSIVSPTAHKYNVFPMV